jgi:hypothetical protein
LPRGVKIRERIVMDEEPYFQKGEKVQAYNVRSE